MKDFGLRLTLAAAAAAALAGCDEPAEEATWSADTPTEFCTDSLGRRVPDTYCRSRYASGGGGSGVAYFRYFVEPGGYIPAVGDSALGGRLEPRRGVAYAPAPAFTAARPYAASHVERGGFGASLRWRGGS